MVWLSSSNNFYPIPTVLRLWYDLPVQHSYTLWRAALSALPSSKSIAWAFTGGCAFLMGRESQEAGARMQQAACTGHEAWGTFQKHINGHCWRRDLLGINLFWIGKQLFLHSGKLCSITALAVPLLWERGKDRFQNGDTQDTWDHHTDPLSPEMTSRSNMSLRPSLKSSSMFSICVPALRRWELHHAVNV